MLFATFLLVLANAVSVSGSSQGKKRLRALASLGEEPAHRVLTAAAQAEHLSELRRDMAALIPEIQAGGGSARDALASLLLLSTQRDSRTVMKTLGVPAVAARLMKSRASSDEIQRLAGSVLTVMSGVPVTSEISDERSGSAGHINIVVPRPSRIYKPDKVLLDLKAGVQPSHSETLSSR